MKIVLDVVLGVGFVAFIACASMALGRKRHWRRNPQIPSAMAGLEGLLYFCLALVCVASAVWLAAGVAFVVLFILLGILQRKIDAYVNA
jgi:uncharacterized membrane protein SirB2